jgi:transposase
MSGTVVRMRPRGGLPFAPAADEGCLDGAVRRLGQEMETLERKVVCMTRSVEAIQCYLSSNQRRIKDIQSRSAEVIAAIESGSIADMEALVRDIRASSGGRTDSGSSRG